MTDKAQRLPSAIVILTPDEGVEEAAQELLGLKNLVYMRAATSKEAWESLRSSPYRCGLFLSTDNEARDWDLTELGDCAVVLGGPSTTNVSSGEEPADEPSEWQRDEQASTESEEEGKVDPSALRKYKTRRLYRDTLQETLGHINSYGQGYTTGPIRTVTTWTVYDGGGAALTPLEFADTVGDRAGEDRLRSQKTVATGLAVGGVTGFSASMLGAMVLLLGDDAGPNREKQLRGAGILTGFAAGFGIPAFIGVYQLNNRVKYISKNYSSREADRWIEEHNAELREDLGLTEEDVREIELRGAMWVLPGETVAPTLGLALSGEF